MSIPATLSMLHSKLEQITSAPLSPCRPATSEAENDSALSGTYVTATSSAFSQSASVSEDGLSVSGSASYAMFVAKSEVLPEINTSAAVNIYPFAPVGVCPHWVTNKSQLSELIWTLHKIIWSLTL